MSLWIGNIPSGWDHDCLHDLFALHGQVKSSYLGQGAKSSDYQWAKVTYWYDSDRQAAIKWGHNLQISWPPGSPHAKYYKLIVKEFDHDKAKETEWESQSPKGKGKQSYFFHRWGITGKQLTGQGMDGKGGTWDRLWTPIPAKYQGDATGCWETFGRRYYKGGGLSQDFPRSQDCPRKGNGKDHGKGQGQGQDQAISSSPLAIQDIKDN